MRPPGRERPLREGVRGRDQGLHRRRRPVRAAVVARDRRRHRRAGCGGVYRGGHCEARGPRARAGKGRCVSVSTEARLIAPHGGILVDRTGERPDDLDALETLTLTAREVSDLDMIASGALSPLQGFMGQADYERVIEEMHLVNGLPWALPVCLAVDESPGGDRVALADEAGTTLAVLEVGEVFEYDKDREAELCFRTTDD